MDRRQFTISMLGTFLLGLLMPWKALKPPGPRHRTVVVSKTKDGPFERTDFERLRHGDYYKMFEPNGDPVRDHVSETALWQVREEPRRGDDGEWELIAWPIWRPIPRPPWKAPW